LMSGQAKRRRTALLDVVNVKAPSNTCNDTRVTGAAACVGDVFRSCGEIGSDGGFALPTIRATTVPHVTATLPVRRTSFPFASPLPHPRRLMQSV
jgi:hypothetical protein